MWPGVIGSLSLPAGGGVIWPGVAGSINIRGEGELASHIGEQEVLEQLDEELQDAGERGESILTSVSALFERKLFFGEAVGEDPTQGTQETHAEERVRA